MDNRLKVIRKFKGLTQTEVAKVLNITQSQYGKYENGKTSISMENAKKLAEYYGVSVPYLLGLDDDSTDTIEIIPGKNIFSELARNKGKSLKEISEEPIPFYNDLNLMLSDFRDSQVVESYIDFISKDKKYNPILLKAFKQFIVDEEGYFLTLISESSENNSPYHYIWEEWIKEKNKKS